MVIRHADPARDAAACQAIYAPFVTDSWVSFEDAAPTPAEMEARMTDYAGRYPWLVADIDGVVGGFAYAGVHRVRPAYRWTVEVSVYVDGAFRRQGVGRTLYETLFPLLRDQGIHTAIAGITLPNDTSIALHESLGFERVGVFRRIGYKAGAWRDVGMWQRVLAEPAPGPPADPGPPGRLD